MSMNMNEHWQEDNLWVKDVGEAEFAHEVINASGSSLVLVDFWADWCGPCKTLTPILEEIVGTYGGLVRLVKVDVDSNQTLAGQMQIRSLPSVYMFLQGDVVDGFVGVISKQEIRGKIDAILQKADLSPPNGDVTQLWEQVETFLEEQKLVEAGRVLEQILQTEAADSRAHLLLAHITLLRKEGSEENVRSMLAQIGDDIKEKDSGIKVGLEELLSFDEEARATVLQDSDGSVDGDMAHDQQRVIVLIEERRFDEAIETLLAMVKRDASWQDGRARETLLRLLSAMGAFDNRVGPTRTHLSNILFA